MSPWHTCPMNRVGFAVLPRMCLLLSLLALVSSVARAQDYRGEAAPVVTRANPIEFSRFRFLTFVFGREGPMDTPLRAIPVAGREYFVEADVFGIESAASIRFELVDATGRSLQTLTMWKSSDGSSDGEFYGFVTVPGQPFRAVISGSSMNGAPFRFASPNLFQPAASGPPDPPLLPPGISTGEAAQLQRFVDDYRRQLQA